LTVCIAALCEGGRQIVTVSDQLISIGHFSGDGLALKDDPIHPNWTALWSGEDISFVPPFIDLVQKQLKPTEEYEWLDVAHAFANARKALLTSEINNRVFYRYPFNRDKFYKDGKADLTPAVFNSIHREASKVKLQCDFLVCGFDERGDGHIFVFDQEGETRSCDKQGFWAIGAGDYAAYSTFFFAAKRNGVNQNSTLEACMYVASSAKFMGESADGVGTKTFMTVCEFNHTNGYVPESVLESYRVGWFKDCAPRIPLEATDFLLANLKPGVQVREG
jgi:hypothetical protein